MSDLIEIKNLHLRTIIGINPEERVNRQDVLVNLKIWADVRKAAESDNIDDAVNYRTICKQVIELVEGSEFLLVEKMVTEIARIPFADLRVEKVWACVEKPGALRFAESVGVSVTRTRTDFGL